MFACSRKDRLFTRSGSPYLALELRDRTGTIQARAFHEADALAGRFERGELVRVSGRVERFRDQPVVEVVDIARVDGRRPVADSDGGGSDAVSARPPTGTSTSSTASSSTSPARSTTGAIGALLDGLLGIGSCGRLGGARRARGAGTTRTSAACSSTRWRWPRSRYEVCQLHPRLNQDLLLTAALVHDLGRTREFTYGAEIGLTDEGRLLGHLVLGEQIVLRGPARWTTSAGSRSCIACCPTTAPPRRRAGGSARSRR